MAQSGYTPLLVYGSSTAAAEPTAGNLTSSSNGAELALNYADGKLFYKNSGGNVRLLAVGYGSSTVTPTAGGVQYGTGSAVAFTGAGSSGQPLLSAGSGAPAYGTLSVSWGGTGATTLTANNVILGNGTSAVQFVAPGSPGNVLTSNGTTWTSAAAGASLSGQTDSASPYETSLGYQAGNSTSGVNNTFIGYQAGLVNSTGTNNTALGYGALDANTNGAYNVAVGAGALGSNTTQYYNTAVGYNALGANTTGASNVAVGCYALDANTTVSDNTAIGYNSLTSCTTGPSNVAIGSGASYALTTGSQNVVIGNTAAFVLTTGSENTAVGHESLFYIGAQSGSTAIGTRALYNDAGGSNTALGRFAGYNVSSGTQNVLIGYNVGNSGTNNLTTGSNNILIGYNVAASSASVSNEVTLGNTSITSTRLRGMVQLNAAMFEQATVSATAATGTINYDTRTQSVLYYTSNASANWTLNIRGASGVSLDSIMSTGQSITVAFLVTNGATAYYQSAFQVDGSSVTPKWQGGTAPTSGNASSVDIYMITVIKTGSATFTAFASQTKFA